MQLLEILDYLKYSELANINLGGEKGVAILDEDLPAIVPHINMALIELYKRFNLKQDELIVQTSTGKPFYDLESKYALNSGSTELNKYIIDTVDKPFTDNLAKVDQVFNEKGEELPLNNPTKETSLFLPRYNRLQVPYADDDIAIFVTYFALPDKINVNSLSRTDDIYLPDILLEPLMFYIGSRLYSNYIDGEIGEGRSYFMKYEDSCKKISQYGLLPTNNTPNENIYRQGWV